MGGGGVVVEERRKGSGRRRERKGCVRCGWCIIKFVEHYNLTVHQTHPRWETYQALPP